MTVKVASPAAWSSGWLTSSRYVRHGDWHASQQQSSSTTPITVSAIPYVGKQLHVTTSPASAVSSASAATGAIVVLLRRRLRNFRRTCPRNLPRPRVVSRPSGTMSVVSTSLVAEIQRDAATARGEIYTAYSYLSLN